MARPTRRAVVTSLTAALAGGVVLPARAATGRPPRGEPPLAAAHAHNDYEHSHPLTDALSHRFGSVEADIWLVDGQLLVSHDEASLDPTRTLQSLYLDPLLRRVRARAGRVYRGWNVPLQLLIDIKTAGEPTYRALSELLGRYREMLTEARDDRTRTRAVTVVVSGDRGARAPMETERVRRAFYDGRLDDLGTGVRPSFMPLVSTDWTLSFRWRGVGEMPASERVALRRVTAEAHAGGQRMRFWATPDVPGAAREALWRELRAAEVDYLNTDDLAGLEAFLRASP